MTNCIGGQVIFSLLLLFWGCDPPAQPSTGLSERFATVPESISIAPGIIDEASGIALSNVTAGSIWTLQDSGQPNALYLISQDGKTIRQYNVPGALNHDWEDLAVGKGPKEGVNYMYIADIGNNNLPLTTQNIIYRIPEITDVNGSFIQGDLEKIIFTYPDGARDAETVMVDPLTKDIFIISKEMDKTGIYRLPYPQSLTGTIVAEKVGLVPSVLFTTGGDISPDGSEILIRNYFSVYYWKRKSGETIGQTLLRAATKQLTIAAEPQGESVCFDQKAGGFFTLSEKGSASSVSLNYYKRE